MTPQTTSSIVNNGVATPAATTQDANNYDDDVTSSNQSSFEGNFNSGDFNDDKTVVSSSQSRPTSTSTGGFFNAAGGPGFPNGSPVSYYDRGVWIDGTVVDFRDGKYVIQWDNTGDDDSNLEYFDSHYSGDRLELEKMVEAAKRLTNDPPTDYVNSDDIWAIGTLVAGRDANGKILYGRISGYRNAEFKITYMDGSTEYIDDFDRVFNMVLNAQSPKRLSSVGGSGLNVTGFTFLFLGIFVAAAALVLVICRCFRSKENNNITPPASETTLPKIELASDDGLDIPSKDDPIDAVTLPVIT